MRDLGRKRIEEIADFYGCSVKVNMLNAVELDGLEGRPVVREVLALMAEMRITTSACRQICCMECGTWRLSKLFL